MKKGKEWLIAKRKENNLTQKQLANAVDISINTLAKIEQGQREGSEETWKKINAYFNNEVLHDDEILTRLENDIKKYGKDKECMLTYCFKNKCIKLLNYRVITLEDVGEKYLKTSLKQALEIFNNQK